MLEKNYKLQNYDFDFLKFYFGQTGNSLKCHSKSWRFPRGIFRRRATQLLGACCVYIGSFNPEEILLFF